MPSNLCHGRIIKSSGGRDAKGSVPKGIVGKPGQGACAFHAGAVGSQCTSGRQYEGGCRWAGTEELLVARRGFAGPIAGLPSVRTRRLDGHHRCGEDLVQPRHGRKRAHAEYRVLRCEPRFRGRRRWAAGGHVRRRQDLGPAEDERNGEPDGHPIRRPVGLGDRLRWSHSAFGGRRRHLGPTGHEHQGIA